MQVSTWMTADPYCTTPDASLDTVAVAMAQGRFRCVPVVDAARRLIGIVTDRDLREHKGFLPSTRVTAAMTETVVAVRPDDPIERAAALLMERKVGGLPVLDDAGQVVGVITGTDLMRGLLSGSGGARAARIDFHFATPQQNFSAAVQAVEAAGGTVLGLGTYQATADGSGARRFFVRITAPDLDAVVARLREQDLVITAVHDPAAAPPPAGSTPTATA
jgi:acetoin utilization protein AcuB